MKIPTIEEIRTLSELEACSDSIEEALESLSEEFNRSETMTTEAFGEQRSALLEKHALVRRRKERMRERASSAPAAAPSPGPVQSLARTPALDAAQEAELEGLDKSLREALARDDAHAMIDIIKTERFRELVARAALDDAAETKLSVRSVLALFKAERTIVNWVFAAHVARRRKLEERITQLEERLPLGAGHT